MVTFSGTVPRKDVRGWRALVGKAYRRTNIPAALQGFSLSLLRPVLIAYIGTSLESFTLLPALSILGLSFSKWVKEVKDRHSYVLENSPGSEPPPQDRIRYALAVTPCRRRSPAARAGRQKAELCLPL